MNISPENITFLAGSFAVPSIMVFLSFMVRKIKGWYYTAGADFLFTEMTFSFASAVLWRDMSGYMHSAFLREVANTVFILTGLLVLLSWLWCVSSVEVEIAKAIKNGRSPSALPQGKIFFAWAMSISFFSAQVMTFLYR